MSTSYMHFTAPEPYAPVFALYKFNPETGIYDTVDHGASWNKDFKSKVDHALANWDKGFDPRTTRPKGFFGKWAFDSTANPAPMIIEREIDTASPNKHFEERKHKGEIVVQQSYSKGKVKIVSIPVASGGSATPFGSDQVTEADFWPLETVPGITLPVAVIGGGYALHANCRIRIEMVRGAGINFPSLHPERVLEFLDACNTEVDPKVITDTLVDLNEGTMDLLTELAELPETIKLGVDTLRMFSQKGKGFRRLMKEIAEESGDPKKLGRLADKLANARLLYRYGILPLSYSLEDIKNVLKEKFKAEFVRAQKSSSKSVDLNSIDADYLFEGAFNAEYKCFAKRALDPSDAFQQFQKVFGMSLPRTMWELTPWSLVVDWFTNAGDALLALSPMPNIGEGSTNSWKTVCEGTLTDRRDPNMKIQISYTHYNREKRQMLDNICLVWDPVLNRDRYMDGLAFSWQLIRNGLRKLK